MARAGRFRHRITIELRTLSQNDYNEPAATWAAWKDWWADVIPLSGNEVLVARQIVATATHQVKLRHCEGLSVKDHRIKLGERVLDINSIVNVDERDREQVLICTEAAS